ncbi:MAG TPA: choice-of-anchor tandem repeat GloVer-containing protein [Aquabacterium sp.]|nr:choice-of-anchor tandem repeat GloVer-containing protein [Aquabacterium sp.]
MGNIQTRKTQLGRIGLTCGLALLMVLTGCGGSSGGNSSNQPSAPAHGGQISVAGLGTNESVTLENNSGNAVTIAANGVANFPASWTTTANYLITVKSHTPNLTCAATQASGSLDAAEALVSVSCSPGSKTDLYSFDGQYAVNPNLPTAGVIVDNAGNLYGTTFSGGSGGNGVVFKLSAGAQGSYQLTNLSEATIFTGPTPEATGQLWIDNAGALYGVETNGGDNNLGSVFKLIPNASGTYDKVTLYSFRDNGDGAHPYGGVVQDQAGNLYGATSRWTASSTIYKLSPTSATTYGFSVLHTLDPTTEGDNILGRLVLDQSGNLYGVANQGGSPNDAGSAFRVTPSGQLTVLHTFPTGNNDGAGPMGSLTLDAAGNLYGTTTGGGTSSKGTVFKLSADGHGGYTESVLYSFAGLPDGEMPSTGVVLDNMGNLFGATTNGGDQGRGVVYRLTPNGQNGYDETVLYSIATPASPSGYHGGTSYGELFLDSSGNLFGTTVNDGANNYGSVFLIN